MAQCIPTQDNVEYIHWIYYIFGDCVYGFQDAVSVLLGYLSIFCWLNAQLPQVVENYKVGSVDSLSINFLSIWLAADFANLVGCLLTHQLPFQRYLGMYFVFIDVCLLLQWIHYSKIKRKRTSFTSSPRSDDKTDPLSKAFQHPSVRTPLLIEHVTKTLEDELKFYSASASPSKWYTLNDHIHHYTDLTHCESNNSSSSSSNTSTSSNNNRNKQIGSVLMAIMLFGTRIPNPTMTTTATAASMTTSTAELDTVVIGRIFAWICTALYLLSRLPQILKNRRRKSVEGLSPALFAFAACGNLTYSSSVLLHPGHTRETLLEAVPYLIGSAGTLVFDATIFLQFLWYRRKSTHPHPHPAISSA